MTLTGQVSRGFRDPTLSERYYRGVTGRGFVTGNPDLDPERSLQYDVALRRPGRVRFGLYLYRYEIRDLVERYREGGTSSSATGARRSCGASSSRPRPTSARTSPSSSASRPPRGTPWTTARPLSDIPPEGLTLTLRRRLREQGWGVGAGRCCGTATTSPGPSSARCRRYGVLDLGASGG